MVCREGVVAWVWVLHCNCNCNACTGSVCSMGSIMQPDVRIAIAWGLGSAPPFPFPTCGVGASCWLFGLLSLASCSPATPHFWNVFIPCIGSGLCILPWGVALGLGVLYRGFGFAVHLSQQLGARRVLGVRLLRLFCWACPIAASYRHGGYAALFWGHAILYSEASLGGTASGPIAAAFGFRWPSARLLQSQVESHTRLVMPNMRRFVLGVAVCWEVH